MVGCAHLLWAFGKAVCYSRRVHDQTKLLNSARRGNKEKGEKTDIPTIPFQACPTLSDLRPVIHVPLKVLPHSKSTKMKTKPLTHRPLGAILVSL